MSSNTVPKYNSNSKNCFWCSSILTGISGLVFMIFGIGYLTSISHDKTQCGIVNVTFPQDLYDTDNLIKCDCGKYCYVHSGTCVRVFGYSVENPNNIVMFQNDVKNNFIDTCTFGERKCSRGEHIENRIEAIKNAKNRAESYIKYIGSKETVTCYQMKENSNLIYLHNEDQTIRLIVSSIIFALFTLCCIVSSCFYCKEK